MPEIPGTPETSQEPLTIPSAQPKIDTNTKKNVVDAGTFSQSTPEGQARAAAQIAESEARVKLLGGFTGDSEGKGASPYLKQYLPPKKQEYKTSQQWKALFEREGATYGEVSSLINGETYSNAKDPNFNPVDYWEDNALSQSKYQPYFERFMSMSNADDILRLQQKIDQEDLNNEIVASASGVKGFAMNMVVQAVDPINWFALGKVGGIYKSLKLSKMSKAVAEAAITGAGGTALSEGILQTQQETRTAEESVINIAAGTILSGIMGGGAKLLSKRKFNNVARKLEKDLSEADPEFRMNPETQALEPKSISAAAVAESEPLKKFYNENYLPEEIAAGRKPLNFDEFSIKAEGLASVLGGETATKLRGALAQVPVIGRITEGVSKTLGSINKISPNLRILTAKYSAKPKEVLQKLTTTGMTTFKNELGIANQQSIWVARKQLVAPFEHEALPKVNDLFKSYVKRAKAEGGEVKKRIDFEKEIVRAMNYGDKSEIPEVASAAQIYRRTNLTPLSTQAVEQGILKLKQFEGDRTYFPQNWNRTQVVAKEGELRDVLTKAIENKVVPQIRNAELNKERNLISQIGELGARRDELQSLIDKVEQGATNGLEIQPPKKGEIRLYRGLENKFDKNFDVSGSDAPAGYSTWTDNPDLARQYAGENGFVYQIDLPTKELGKDVMDEEGERFLFFDNQKKAGLNNVSGKEFLIYNDHDNYNPDLIKEYQSGGGIKTKPTDEDLLLLDQWKANMKTLKENRPKSLLQFIKENGGIHDTGGELRSMDINYKTKPGLVRKNLTAESSQDAVALRAWEAGYFPEYSKRPTINDLLEAIDREARGEKRFSELDLEKTERINEANAFFDDLNSRGIFDDDIKKIDDAKLLKTKIKETGETVDKLLIKKEIELIQRKIDRLDDMMKDNRVAFEARFEDAGDQENYVNEIVSDIIGNLKKERYGSTFNDFVIAQRGPMKHRALDFLEYDEISQFLNNDATDVLKAYARIMSTDIELAKAFDGDLTMSNTLDDIAKDYEMATIKAKTPQERKKIDNEKKRVIADIEALRDRSRGNYGNPDDPDSILTRTFQAGRKLNFMQKMGGVVISSFVDITNPIAIHGLKRWMPAIGQVITNIEGIKLNVAEAKLAGNILERTTLGRMASMAEIGDPFHSNRSSFERLLDNGVKLMSKLNLMPIWNDVHKSFSSVMTQQRIIKESQNWINGSIKQNDRTYLAFLGIGEDEARLISEQVKQFGYKDKGLWVANTEKWKDKGIATIYRNALNTDVDRTIVTLGAGDVPLFMSSEVGKTIGQFKSFAFASTQQVLIARLQQKDAAALQGLIGAVSLGMLTYYLKTIGAGKEPSKDPKKWVVEGLDRSGYLGVLMEVNNISEKMTGGKVGVNALIDGENMSRYASRNITSTLIGPSAGLIEDITRMTTAIANGEIKKSDVKAFRRMAPYQNVFYLQGVATEAEEKLNEILGAQ